MEMQIKITIRYHFTPVRQHPSQRHKEQNNQYWLRYGHKKFFIHKLTADRNVNLLKEKLWKLLKKVRVGARVVA